jgi:hypothetical protein
MNEKEFINTVIRRSTGAWFETHGKIWARDRSKGIITPRLNYLQRKIQAVVDKCEDLEIPVRLLGLKPRARGSTTFFSALGYTLMRRTSTSAVFIGGQSDQTVGLWNMLKTYHANDTFDWKNSGDINEKGATFSNGSRAKKETAKDVQAGIGDTYSLLHATEAARWSQFGVANASDVMANILKAVPLLPHTYVFLESTAEIAGGDFYERWLKAVDADDFLSGKTELKQGEYIRIFAAWFEFEESSLPNRLNEEERDYIQTTLDAEDWYHGEKELVERYGIQGDDGVTRLGASVRNIDWVDQIAWRRYSIDKECKKDLSNFDRDFPHSWQDAFLKTGNTRFNMSGMAAMRKRLSMVTPKYGVLELPPKAQRPSFRQTTQAESIITIFEQPVSGAKYLLAVDPMTGITQTGGKEPDRHGAFVLRAGYWDSKGKWVRAGTAARINQCRFDIDVLEVHLWRLALFYGNSSGCMIAIEVNMDRGLIELLKIRGANLYQRELWNRRDFKMTQALGFQTNTQTREMIIETLAAAIREYDTPGRGVDIWCPLAIEQCENFVRKTNGRSEAADGWKDDDVLALSLGLELIEHATVFYPPRLGFGLPPDLRETATGRGPTAYS